jgi:hypothetical protein
MKFETHVHHLLDAIRREKISGGYTVTSNYLWNLKLRQDLNRLKQVPVLVLRDPLNAYGTNEEWVNASRALNMKQALTLPYVDVFVEAVRQYQDGETQTWIILAERKENGGFAIMLFVTTEHGWMVYPATAWTVPGQSGIEIGLVHEDDATPGVISEDEHDTIRGHCLNAVVVVGVLSMLMAAPAIEVQSETITVPREVNRGRSLLNKSRVPDHTILTLPKVVHVSPDGQSLHGTHASPKTHWRRSHERHYASGKVVRVPETVVNHRPGAPLPPPPVTEVRINL